MPDEWTEEHLPIRVITDCKSLFECLAKDAPQDRGTAWTVASLRERCSAGAGRDTKTLGFDVGAGTSAVGRRTDKIIGWSLLEKCSNLGNRSASRREYRQSERSSRRLSCPKDLEQKDWWQ